MILQPLDFEKGGNMYSIYANLRDSKGLTDNAVAVAVGITQSTIYDWKQRANKNPDAKLSIDNLKKIADYFGVSIEYFLEEQEA